jgi:hypothetical protein
MPQLVWHWQEEDAIGGSYGKKIENRYNKSK